MHSPSRKSSANFSSKKSINISIRKDNSFLQACYSPTKSFDKRSVTLDCNELGITELKEVSEEKPTEVMKVKSSPRKKLRSPRKSNRS